MLQQMRERFRYLKWLLVIIVFMFVWWAFATWGGGASTRRPTGDWAARVNGREISVAEFQAYARRLDGTYQSILGDQYAQQRALMRIGQQAIQALVDQELVYQEALRQGLGASSQEVAEAITRDPGLQENGQFIGLRRYRDLFRGNRISIGEYEDQVRRDLVIDKFRSLVVDAVSVSDADVEEEFLKRNRKSTIEYLVADPMQLAPKSKPSDAEIARYYDEHTERYSTGEGRTGLYVLFSPAAMAAGEAVTDADVQAAYDRLRDSRYAEREQRRASHILFKVGPTATPADVARVEAKARGVLARARAGEDFAALARRHSEDGSAPGGGDLNFFGRGQMVKEFEDAAFGLQVGDLSDLVRTPYGFHIIKVTDARAARTVPFEEARDALREELKMERARAAVQKRSEDFARAARGGKLETVAQSQGLEVRQTGAVHDGEALPDLAASQAVVARMKSLARGEVSEPIPVPAGQVVVQVTGEAPSVPRPLAEIRARVEKDLQNDGALAVIEQKRAAAARAGGLKALARALKLDAKTQADVTDGASLPGVPPDPAIERQIASLPPGTIGPPVPTSAGIVVLSVTQRLDHRDELETQRDSIRDGLARQRQDRLYRALVKRLRDGSAIDLNAPVVQSLDRG
jgi:peptidyl-prolyl cis-trans isomerase D